MKRPALLRLLPSRLRQILYFRYYRSRHAEWHGLFERAPLAFSPNAAMYGLRPGDEISGSIAFNGFYELELTRAIVRQASRGNVFVDIGANMGYFSLLWAGLNPAGRVIAFEAAPRNIALIQNNIRQNHLSDRVIVVPKAAGRQAGTICFDEGPADQTGWGGIASSTSPHTIDVPVVRVDDELPDMTIDVLKVDVEGADTWVLLGCEALLKKKRIGTIFFEQNTPRMEKLGIDSGEARTFLKDLDYSCIQMDGGDAEWIAYPNTTAG